MKAFNEARTFNNGANLKLDKSIPSSSVRCSTAHNHVKQQNLDLPRRQAGLQKREC